jgi:cleavage and polyadenylation specificity factor subunit 2
MITFKPLSGAAQSSPTAPLCYLLEVDDVRILLDCGSPDWSPESQQRPFQWEPYCDALKECAPTVDLVLISHGDLAHSGLYAYAYTHWNLHAPAYTTLPVQAMARIATMEDIEGLRSEEDFSRPSTAASASNRSQSDGGQEVEQIKTEEQSVDSNTSGKYVATIDEVQDAFDAINTLRYSQPTHLQGKCQGLTITPFNAGHTLGGTIWKIRSPSSGTFVYAVNMSHMRERHLDGTVLMRGSAGGIFESLARPDVFITDAERADVTTARRKDRDAAFIDTITATLSSRSSLLIPCDASTRILELLVLLDQHWSFSKLRYPICLLSRSAEEMLTFVRSMMEWLGGTINKEDVGEDSGNRRNKRKRDDEDEALGALALRFPHVEFFSTPQALLGRHSSKDPKLILAVPASMSHGPSRSVFADFAALPDNVILLTGRCEEGTLGRALFERWNDSQRSEDKWDKGKIGNNIMLDGSLKIRINSKVPLQGTELDIYLQREKAAKEKEAARVAAAQRSQQILEADADDSDSDSDSDDSDNEDEAEVREALAADDMDTSQDNALSQPQPSKKKKKKGEDDMDQADWGNIDDEGLTKQLLSYDIYIKGNASKSTSFFKSSTQSQRFRMFPFIERKRRVDEYGEIIDVGTWIRKGKDLEADTETEDAKDFRRRKQLEEEAKAQQEPPSKYISTEVEVQLACRLLFLDMEGLNDGRAVKTIVPQVNPRKMILVRASAQATNALIESCANIRSMTQDIFAPASGETIQIGQQINSFSISINDDLLKSLRMSSFEDNEIAYVTGRIIVHSNANVPTLEPLLSNLAIAAPTQPFIPKTLGSGPPVNLPQSSMIGELKLTALKARLATVGIQAELIGEGVLMCGSGIKSADGTVSLDNSVAVKKTGKGKVELEGSVSDVYYAVRKEIYNLHALVSAQN